MNTDRKACNSGFQKRFLLQTITNTDGEELITVAHEISMQIAVMSGLEDVNSSKFFTRSDMNNFCGHSLKLYKKHFCKVNEYSKFGLNFHKKCCYQRTIKYIRRCLLINVCAFLVFPSFLMGYYLVLFITFCGFYQIM